MADIETVHVGVTSVLATMMPIFGFFGIRLIKQVDKNTDGINSHLVDDATKYITKAEVKDSLDRIHTRIDDVADDIKTLLGRK